MDNKQIEADFRKLDDDKYLTLKEYIYLLCGLVPDQKVDELLEVTNKVDNQKQKLDYLIAIGKVENIHREQMIKIISAFNDVETLSDNFVDKKIMTAKEYIEKLTSILKTAIE